MKLRNKISIITIAIWIVMMAVTYIGSHFILETSYLQLEKKLAMDNVQRVNEALEQIVNTVNTMVANWAVWDDTYQFVIDKNQAYIKSNLVISNFTSADVDIILFFNMAGKPVYTMAANELRTEKAPLPDKIMDYLLPTSKLVALPAINTHVQGLISIPSAVYFISAHPIVTSNNEGPVHGTIIMAKKFSSEVLKKIQKITKLDLVLYRPDAIHSDPQLTHIQTELEKTQNSILERNDEKLMLGYSLLKDINGKTIGIIKVKMPRNIYSVGITTIHYYNFVLLAYSIVMIIFLWMLLQKLIVKRIEKLNTRMLDSDYNKNTMADFIDGVPDEVSSVATLYHQATHDPLTGLANRNLLYQVFNHQKKRLKEKESLMAILFLDLDKFKHVNDSLGHDIGDKLLIYMALRLKSCLRKNDLAARLGGDEFVALLIGANPEQIQKVIDRIYLALAKPIIIEDHELYLSSSMGISIYPVDGDDIETLLKQADIALYKAKERGHNHFQYYSAALNEAIQLEYRKEIELQRAIDNKELCLFYQPIYNVLTKKIISIEALLRWNHPERGIVNAGEIIPVAEKSGLIISIEKWVLKAVCNQAAEWKKKGLLIAPIAVNLSVQQMKYVSISQFIINELHFTGLDPTALELELTESGFIELTPSILNELTVLRDRGIQLAVDDFGTGYSGLGYLKKLPVSKLKIDRSFINDIQTDPDDRAIALAIINMAHQLNLKVIGEGVETVDQLNFLRDNQVDAAQGNYLCPPVNKQKCEGLLITFTKESSELA